ncbi:FAD-dependent oxidoreductase [Burkholderia multivorans]|uniref:NAD(P)/FAD-dependent oxidoreductase n=1 Tax=Burkholderia multivorans TaxID=87883 RepID=UPI0012DF2FDC|nr:FAD-dependent oxidoreductase [Burkholderia multivorans]MBU9342010.1 FAD-binding oxidoreductase [Burkholderia multivorans]MCA8143373.1 FAD-binding oxidoreductase [Burkholderia multivorans]QGR59836.1 FAD-dependent oxidoreductase [Burkholderia multivorans]WVN03175.1 FAD-dependent oxidoreductase [Burkholderia multivorans]
MTSIPSLLERESRFEATQLNIEKDNWNWCDPARYDGERPANWYEASLSRWENAEPLAHDAVCDVLVIGAGLLGASAALHLAEAGVDTILVDKHHVGSAASGRNGGQLTPGLARWEAADMIERLAHEDAKRLWRFASSESMALIDAIAARYALDLDRGRGHVTAAVHPGHMSALLDGADARRHLGDASVTLVGKHQLHDEYVRSPLYHGAAIDALGGQLHPLALVRGLVYGFRANGGGLYECTEVLELDETPAGVVATTPGGTITARKGVVLALHNTTFRLFDDGAATTVPFFTYVSVTAPLDVDVASLMPAGMPVYDTQFQIDYYRPVRGNRLLFGGQGTGTCWPQHDANAYLLTRLNAVFPQYDGRFALDYSWSGVSDFTLNGATDSRKTDGRVPVYMVQGWSGHGVAQTVRIGKAICDDFVGRNDDFSMLTGIDHREIPLGRQLSPVAIPAAKAAMSVMTALNPGKMISF